MQGTLSRARVILASAAMALALAACASDGEPEAAAPAPPPPASVSEAPAPSGDVAAPGVSVAPPSPPPAPGDIVVPGGPDRQVNPSADPRTQSERMTDIRAWDQCVMRAQSVGDSDPMRPQMESPEELCSRSLGMSNRTAVPDSRLQRR